MADIRDITVFSSDGEKILGVVVEHYTNPLDDFYVVYADYALYKFSNPDENATGTVNPYTTGMYYIDSMEFEYKTENHKIQQFLYLIKRDGVTNPINRSIEPLALTKNETT